MPLELAMIESVLKPAEELKSTSISVTNALIDAFMSTPETRVLYVNSEIRIADKLQQLAESGFYDTTNVIICDLETSAWVELSDTNKDIFRHLLLNTLSSKGYQAEDVSKHSQQLVFRISF